MLFILTFRKQLTRFRTMFENTYFSFFSDLKKTWLFTFFEMTYQKVVKSHQQKFSPQYVTKEWSLFSMITVIQFLAPKSHCWTFWLIGSIGRNKITNATWLRPELVTLSTSIPTSNRCSCSRWITRKQTSTGNVGQCRILTAVKRTINIKQPYIRVSKLNIWLDYDANRSLTIVNAVCKSAKTSSYLTIEWRWSVSTDTLVNLRIRTSLMWRIFKIVSVCLHSVLPQLGFFH